jgi:hypothetical protein
MKGRLGTLRKYTCEHTLMSSMRRPGDCTYAQHIVFKQYEKMMPFDDIIIGQDKQLIKML